METEREVKETERCLLQSNLQFPQKAVFKCKFCSARTDDVGDLGKVCQAVK